MPPKMNRSKFVELAIQGMVRQLRQPQDDSLELPTEYVVIKSPETAEYC